MSPAAVVGSLTAPRSPDVNVASTQGPLPFVKLTFQDPAMNCFLSSSAEFFQSTQMLVVELVWGQESLAKQGCRKAWGRKNIQAELVLKHLRVLREPNGNTHPGSFLQKHLKENLFQ